MDNLCRREQSPLAKKMSSERVKSSLRIESRKLQVHGSQKATLAAIPESRFKRTFLFCDRFGLDPVGHSVGPLLKLVECRVGTPRWKTYLGNHSAR